MRFVEFRVTAVFILVLLCIVVVVYSVDCRIMKRTVDCVVTAPAGNGSEGRDDADADRDCAPPQAREGSKGKTAPCRPSKVENQKPRSGAHERSDGSRPRQR